MRRLVIVRPEPGASATLAKARDLGLDGVAMPLFEIEPVEWQAPEASGFDGLLLTSANALRHGGGQLGALRGLRVYAVGEATAEAARAAGFDIAGTGDAGVERLLGSIDSGCACSFRRAPHPGDRRRRLEGSAVSARRRTAGHRRTADRRADRRRHRRARDGGWPSWSIKRASTGA